MPQDLTNDESALVQIMSWCLQAPSHYLSQCWPRSMALYDITTSRWFNGWWASLDVISHGMMPSSNENIFNRPIFQRPVTQTLMFSLIYIWPNGWANNRDAGDLRCYHAHYDVTVMIIIASCKGWCLMANNEPMVRVRMSNVRFQSIRISWAVIDFGYSVSWPWINHLKSPMVTSWQSNFNECVMQCDNETWVICFLWVICFIMASSMSVTGLFGAQILGW